MATAPVFFSLSTPHFFHHQKNPKLSTLSVCRPRLIFSVRAALSTRVAKEPPPLAAAPAACAEELIDISKLGISEQIVSALSRRGITELFPIQRAVLEPAMEGRDMIGRAVTGSGKTLAFGIPILDKIIRHQTQHGRKGIPSALVLAPTRELARQVQQEFKVSAPKLSSTCLYGGIPIGRQVQTLGFGVDIVVGTPGRIIDLVERRSLDLSEVKFVVLDEADQMLAVGFQEDVENILSYLPARKQCMLFSATMPSWVRNISRKFLQDPLVVDLISDTDKKLAEGISFYSVATSSSNKQNLLPTLISRYAQGGKCIIFTKTKIDAESLSRSMGSIIGSKALHGNMQQLQRDRTLAAFRDGRFDVLVATDVAARGLDITNVDLVIHFEMPNSTEFFVHRSGRTGRAGKKGIVILMFTERQRRDARSIEQDLGFKFEELQGITGSSVGTRIEVEGSLFDSRNESVYSKPRYPTFDSQYGSNGRSEGLNTSRYSEGKNFSSATASRSRGSNTSRYSEGRNFSSGAASRSRGSNTSRYSEGRNFSSGAASRSQGWNSSRYSEGRNSSGAASRPSHEPNFFTQPRRTQLPTYDDYNNGHHSSSQSYPRLGAKKGSNFSDKPYANDKNSQRKMKQRYHSESNDCDFDDLLDLFKD
ncbi:DEAD-box ATP-dependent RNA helicase 53-like [Iris pallida]|uniref:DEAD-box ATP-dependent RNA helicase 53-like n=1 Tax=Iris pallida TaxID=29817 RepID=A0AAX6I9V8_IRIPA|nr:DEAD-box ATP-dependent RNA helicase 53-like [Iris pallida]KAJ6849205.1 DEAD-box ATP-dependent RNA helicase 53-like [Iris pallida]